MQAGKQLDELVAQHVLGWREDEGKWRDPETDEDVALRPFSKDVAAAFELAYRICDTGYRLQLDGARIWQARFYKSIAHTLETKAFAATGSSPEAAICLALLAMHGVELPK